jgi:hypothetical protein
VTLQIPKQLLYQIEVIEKKRCAYCGSELNAWSVKGQGIEKHSCNIDCASKNYWVKRKIEKLLNDEKTDKRIKEYLLFLKLALKSGIPSKIISYNMNAVIKNKASGFWGKQNRTYAFYHELWNQISI